MAEDIVVSEADGEPAPGAPGSVLRQTDSAAIRLAKTLMRSARHAAIAAIDPTDGSPLASRVGVATDFDGAPLILVSQLSAHTRALQADPRCSLLFGDPGKGDPLAHPRITVVCRAEKLEPDSTGYIRARRRYLNHNPKAQLYVGLGDFVMMRLEPQRASLNGGFGKAYALSRDDLLSQSPAAAQVAAAEQAAIEHMNSEHLDAVVLYARHYAHATGDGWKLIGIDVDGFDVASGDEIRRIFFPDRLDNGAELRNLLVAMAREARGQS